MLFVAPLTLLVRPSSSLVLTCSPIQSPSQSSNRAHLPGVVLPSSSPATPRCVSKVIERYNGDLTYDRPLPFPRWSSLQDGPVGYSRPPSALRPCLLASVSFYVHCPTKNFLRLVHALVCCIIGLQKLRGPLTNQNKTSAYDDDFNNNRGLPSDWL